MGNHHHEDERYKTLYNRAPHGEVPSDERVRVALESGLESEESTAAGTSPGARPSADAGPLTDAGPLPESPVRARRLTVLNNLTLDGVMQGPGRRDEDTRHGFADGGWAQAYADAVLGEYLGSGMETVHELVLGRRTWEDFASFWPTQEGNPFSNLLGTLQKHVASRTLHEPLAWANSTLLPGDAVQAVEQLLALPGPDLLCMGSGQLLQGLMAAGLVDEYTLLIHPLLLGRGERMFDEGLPRTEFTLVEAITTTTGVIIAVYRPER